MRQDMKLLAAAVVSGVVTRLMVIRCKRRRKPVADLEGLDGSEGLRKAVKEGCRVGVKRLVGRVDKTELGVVLHMAVVGGDGGVVEELLWGGADPNVDVEGRYAVHVAADRTSNGADILQLLVKHGADVNMPQATNSNVTPLHILCTKGNMPSIVALLASPNIQPDLPNSCGWRPVHLAAATNRPAVLDLLEPHASLNSPNSRGSTPLHLACTAQAHAATKWLALHNADVTVTDGDGNTPLHFLMLSTLKHPVLHELLDMFLERGADVTAKNMRGRTPLHNGLQRGHGRLSAFLLIKGADVTAQDDQLVTPIHLAASCGDLGMLTLLLDARPVNPNIPDIKGRTPLAVAAANGYDKCIEFLLTKGASVDTMDANSCTPLITALKNDRKMASLILLRNGADGMVVDGDGNTPLAIALHQGKEHSSLAEELITKHKVDVNCMDSEGRTPLHWAAANGAINLCTLLLSERAGVSARTNKGVTPLHWAAGEGEVDATEMMLIEGNQQGIPDWANVSDNDGRTPLHWALRYIERGHAYTRVCELLLENGAKLRQEDNRGIDHTRGLSETLVDRFLDAEMRGESKKSPVDVPFGAFTAFGGLSDD